VALAQTDELGQLATAFNSMAQGIAEREAQLTHQAHHDGLTGLPNRTLFHHLLQQAIAGAARNRGRLAVLLLDLDRFKEVNDTLGHNIGDVILREVGPRLAAAVRRADTVARLGGDECAILLRDLDDPRDATDVVLRIRAALEEPFVIEGQSIQLSASVGIAFYPEHGEDGTTLVRRADVAMYGAKRSGAGVAVYSVELDPHSPRRLALMGELRQTLERGGLALHYQPKVDLTARRITDVEALLRWHHPQHGLMAPGEFIPLAEQTGLMGPLTRWAIDAALRQRAAWQGAGLDLGVAVNLSARVLQDEEFPRRVAELLEQHRVPASGLILEVTESAIMADPACARRIVTELHELGVRLSIDDFGTGYSSLAYLKQLPVAELKIDKSFVIGLTARSHDDVIVRSTIDLAHNLEIKVTAEGVESRDVCERLRRHGCDHAQGYFISRPVPAPILERWLRETDWARPRAPRAAIPA
jgi:diguanylate cyclase (GGDEF)-like protein